MPWLCNYSSPVGQAVMRPRGQGRYSVIYSKPGTYVFKCEATDEDKLTGSSTMTVNVVDLRGNHTCQF